MTTTWEVDPGRPLERYRVLVLLLAFSACLQVLTLGNGWGAPDERERVEAAEQLLDHGTLRLTNGRHTKYPPLTSVLTAPGVLLKRLMPGHNDAWLMVPSLVAGSACVAPVLWSLWAVGIPLGGSVVAGAVFAVANPVWPYTKRLYSEPFTALFVMCAFALGMVYRAHRRRRDLALMWMWTFLAVGNNSVALTLVPLLVGLSSVERMEWPLKVDRRALLWGVLGSGLVVGSWLLTNWVKFGNPLDSGYRDTATPNDVFDGRSGFSTPLWVGLYGLLFSGGRGMVLYAPMTLLGAVCLRVLRHRFKGAAGWLFLGGLLPLLVYSCWWSWHGGTCYGPRLMTPFMGLWMLGVAPLIVELRERTLGGRLTRWMAALVCVWQMGASFTGTLFMFSYDQMFWIRDRPFNDFLDVYTPQYSLIFRNWKNAWNYPDDINWLWLTREPRRPLTVDVRGKNVAAVQVDLTGQALRNAWEIAEIYGVGPDGLAIAPLTVSAKEGRTPEAMNDGTLATVWSGGLQRPGLWVRAEFEPGHNLESIVFMHGQQGGAWPRFATVRVGPNVAQLGPAMPAETPRGGLGWHWMGWLTLLGLAVGLRGIQRWSGWWTLQQAGPEASQPPVG